MRSGKSGLSRGQLVLEQIDLLTKRGADFGFETTLAGRGHLNLAGGLKKRGYGIHFFYLWLPSVDLALSRVKERVSRGGRCGGRLPGSRALLRVAHCKAAPR